jgi:hypothetical protein
LLARPALGLMMLVIAITQIGQTEKKKLGPEIPQKGCYSSPNDWLQAKLR